MTKGRVHASHADFVGIHRRVANSAAFMALPPIARALYLDLRRQYNGHNNGQIAAVLEGTEDRPGLVAYGWPPRTVFKYLKVLVEHGLIEMTRQGGIAAMSKTCSLYAFTEMPVVANKEKCVSGSMASLAYLYFTPKVRAQRTRQKKSQGARGASIAACGARTQVHAVPTDHPINARSAANNFSSKVIQAVDVTVKSDNSATKTAKESQVHEVHTLITLPREGTELDLEVDTASVRRKAALLPDTAKLMLCQHGDCDTPVVGREFCAKHRPLRSERTAAEQSTLATSSQ